MQYRDYVSGFILLETLQYCDAGAQTALLVAYCARGRNRRDGLSILQFFSKAVAVNLS